VLEGGMQHPPGAPTTSGSSSSSSSSSSGMPRPSSVAPSVQDLAVTMYALALLQQHPPSPWVTMWWATTRAAGLASLPPHTLSLMMWSVASLGLVPPSDWWEAWLEATAAAADR
jgi:hypothetical protein